MKKLKFLTLAAIAAATAMVSSCSDNDVLEGVKDTGIPFSVTASTNSGGSRGSDITTLSNFQLWGFGTEQTSHFDGDNFTPKAGSTTVFESSVTPNWPNTDNCLFYGISDNTSTMAYGVTEGPGVNSTKAEIRNGSFTYTIPTNVADQKDLLVAAATGNSNDGVQLKFDHALTAARLHFTLDPSKTASNDDHLLNGTLYGFIVKIRKVKIHNIKVSGTYTFDGVNKDAGGDYVNGLWNTASGALGDYVLDFESNPLIISHTTGSVFDFPVDVDGGNGNIYFIPQDITYWDIVPNDGTSGGSDLSVPGTVNNYSYIECEAIALNYALVDVINCLDAKVANDDAWTKNADGDYCYNGNIVAKSTGQVVNYFDNADLNDIYNGVSVETQLYDFDNAVPEYHFSDLVTDGMYGVFYTPFKATLKVNGLRNLKVSLDQAVITANDGSALFGVSAEGGA